MFEFWWTCIEVHTGLQFTVWAFSKLEFVDDLQIILTALTFEGVESRRAQNGAFILAVSDHPISYNLTLSGV